MGRRPTHLVKYIAALMFSKDELNREAKHNLETQFGEIDQESPAFRFTHTEYYAKEMGPDLMKQFVSFKKLKEREELVSLKLYAMGLEDQFAKAGQRQVNIDPAYLELAKLVVASRKNFDHRIYLGKGVFADLQLRYRHGQFVALEWTYPDYQSEIVLTFLQRVRARYYDELNCVAYE
ncbi:MAG: DUF4416 family protein [bacterium]